MAHPYPGSPRFSHSRWKDRGKRVQSLTARIIEGHDGAEMVEARAKRVDGTSISLVVPSTDPLVHWVTVEKIPRRYSQRRQAEARERFIRETERGKAGGVRNG